MKRSGDLLRDMGIFVKLVETQSFTEAGRSLGLPKSTVSRRIDALEESLGVRLVLRNNRGLAVTETGMAYYQRARRVLGLAEDALQAVVGEERLRGTLRMTAPRGVGSLIVADVLYDFMRLHPGVSAELMLTDRRVDMTEGRFDLAVRIGLETQAPPGFEATPLSPTWILLCASPAYVARHGLPEKPADMARHQAVVVRFLGGTRWRLRGPAGVVEVDVAGRLSVDDVIMAERAARAGLGIAPIVAALAAPCVRAGRLVHVLPEHSFEVRSVYALYPPGALRPPKTRRLIEHMVTHLRAAFAERIGPLSPLSAPVPPVEHPVPLSAPVPPAEHPVPPPGASAVLSTN